MTADYQDDYQMLAREFDINRSRISLNVQGHENVEIRNIDFESRANWVHGDAGGWGDGPGGLNPPDAPPFSGFETPDDMVEENVRFRCPVFVPPKSPECGRFILFFHGLNERRWDKYLPWALSLAERCRRPVILFPMAFHMNRSPAVWGNARKMKPMADLRKRGAAEGGATSFLNAAISHRLERAPHRFLSSGLQTYYDVVQLLGEIRSGAVPFISPRAGCDIFAYSIGAFLGEVLLTSNPDDCFESSRLFMFCGGGTLDTSRPVSRTILDASAYDVLFAWFQGLFRNIEAAGRRVRSLMSPENPAFHYFKSFLFADRMEAIRSAALRRAGARIKCLGLLKDQVFSPAAIGRSLSGSLHGSGIELVTRDFEYEYKHEEPFPMLKNSRAAVNRCFHEIFTMASEFLCGAP